MSPPTCYVMCASWVEPGNTKTGQEIFEVVKPKEGLAGTCPANLSFGMTITIKEYNSIVGVMPKEGLAVGWCNKLKTCFSVTWCVVYKVVLMVKHAAGLWHSYREVVLKIIDCWLVCSVKQEFSGLSISCWAVNQRCATLILELELES